MRTRAFAFASGIILGAAAAAWMIPLPIFHNGGN